MHILIFNCQDSLIFEIGNPVIETFEMKLFDWKFEFVDGVWKSLPWKANYSIVVCKIETNRCFPKL